MSTSEPDGDVEIWSRWKRVHERVRSAVLAEVSAAAGASEAELSVLLHLDAAGGVERQNALVASLGWDRSRLSHLLTRMEDRGLLSRRKLANGVEVVTADDGARALGEARPTLQAAVRRHLLGRLGAEDAAALDRILATLDA